MKMTVYSTAMLLEEDVDRIILFNAKKVLRQIFWSSATFNWTILRSATEHDKSRDNVLIRMHPRTKNKQCAYEEKLEVSGDHTTCEVLDNQVRITLYGEGKTLWVLHLVPCKKMRDEEGEIKWFPPHMQDRGKPL
jgi:hypothetical protein